MTRLVKPKKPLRPSFPTPHLRLSVPPGRVGGNPRRAPCEEADVSAASSLTPTLSPRRGRNVRRVFGNTSDGIGDVDGQATESMIGKILSPGERIQVRAGVKTNRPCPDLADRK